MTWPRLSSEDEDPVDEQRRAALARTRELVASLRAGDVDAFRAVYVEYYHRLWEFAYGMVRTEAGAEDAVQDVFSVLWINRDTLAIHDTVDVYLFGAVRHRVLNMLRHARLADHKQQAMHPDAGIPGLGTPLMTPFGAAAAADFDAALRRAVDRLPSGQQQAILLHWRHGLSTGEIARVAGVSANAAAAQLMRARNTLRRLLRSYFDR
jgi:RNA polymerase sigma-70 factor (ECF subfamily)